MSSASNQIRSTKTYLWYISDVLGTGATSTVYKGRHKKTGELVAAKAFNSLSFMRPQSVQQVFNVLVKIDHLCSFQRGSFDCISRSHYPWVSVHHFRLVLQDAWAHQRRRERLLDAVQTRRHLHHVGIEFDTVVIQLSDLSFQNRTEGQELTERFEKLLGGESIWF